MRIPLLDLQAQYRSIKPEIDATMQRVVENQAFILGSEVEAFEAEIAAYVGAQVGVGVSSCSDALFLALTSLGIGGGDEVITSTYSFFATAEAIARCGATPVFVDIEADTMQMDPGQAIERVTPKTKAFVAVHLFGRCCDVAALHQAAPSIPTVEDAAQAIGAELGGSRAGALGCLGCFSFFPSKNLGGFGDGGMVTSNSAELADRVRALRIHGQPRGRRHEHTMIGGNFRLDALQAAILRVKLRHLETWTGRRRANAARYRQLFGEAGTELLLPPAEAEGCRDVYNQFVIRVPGDRDALRAQLSEHGIGTGIYYPRPQHLQPCLAHLGYKEGDFPHAEAASRQNVCLPVYPELEDEQICEVVDRNAGWQGSPPHDK